MKRPSLPAVGHVREQVEQVAGVRGRERAAVAVDQRPASAGGEVDVGEQAREVERGRVLAAAERGLALHPHRDRRHAPASRAGSRRPSTCRRARSRAAGRPPGCRRRTSTRSRWRRRCRSRSASAGGASRGTSRAAGLPAWARSASTAIATFSVDAAGNRARAFQAAPRPRDEILDVDGARARERRAPAARRCAARPASCDPATCRGAAERGQPEHVLAPIAVPCRVRRRRRRRRATSRRAAAARR